VRTRHDAEDGRCRGAPAFAANLQSAIATCASVLAAVGFGLVPIFAKNLTDAGIAAQAVAFYRYLLVAIVLLPFLSIGQGMRSATLWGVLCGAAMGIGWTGYVKAVESAPVSTVGILYMTYPMFTLAIAWLLFRQQPGFRSIVAALTVLTAAVVATTPALTGNERISALLIALTAPVTFGFAINVLANKLSSIPPLSRIASVALGAVLGLLPLIVSLEAERLLPASPADWWMIVGIAVVTALIPQLLYVISAPRIGAAKSAMAGSMELPTMLLVGWLAFGEPIGPTQLVAAAMLLTAVAITPNRRLEPE